MEYTQFYISKAHWDSSNFNINIGNVFIEITENTTLTVLIDLIKQVIYIGKKEQYQLLYLKLPAKLQLPKLSLQCKDIILADIKVIYEKQVVEKPLNQNKYITNYTESEANEALLNLAFESGKYSRFRLDPNFPPGTFEKMYSIWINKSIKNNTDENVLVYQIQCNILGMLSYTIQPTCTLIELIAVNKSHQGQNIGSELLSSLEYIVRNERTGIIEVATQKKNTAACNFYQKNNFNIKQETNIYHIWL